MAHHQHVRVIPPFPRSDILGVGMPVVIKVSHQNVPTAAQRAWSLVIHINVAACPPKGTGVSSPYPRISFSPGENFNVEAGLAFSDRLSKLQILGPGGQVFGGPAAPVDFPSIKTKFHP